MSDQHPTLQLKRNKSQKNTPLSSLKTARRRKQKDRRREQEGESRRERSGRKGEITREEWKMT